MEHRASVEVVGPHQTRPAAWPQDAATLADELEAVMAGGTHDVPAIVAGLNARAKCAGPGGVAWTEAALRQRLAELGAEGPR